MKLETLPMLSQFRCRYPQGSLTSELVEIDHGLYIVKVTVQVEGCILASGLAAQPRIEEAEDLARTRALMTLDLELLPPAAPAPNLPVLQTTSGVAPLETQEPQPLPLPLVREPEGPAPKTKTKKKEVKEAPPPEPEIVPEGTGELELVAPKLWTAPPSYGENGYTHEPETSALSLEPAPQELTPIAFVEDINEPEVEPTPEVIDFSEIIARSNIELKRLGWTSDQGRNYLLQTYGKRSRQLLSDEELLEFLQYLESQPAP